MNNRLLHRWFFRIGICAFVMGLAALPCAPSARAAQSEVPAGIAAVLASPDRPPADVQRDALRMPAQTLVFAGAKPGQQIGELLPGGGYFTRIFSLLVGPQGHVYAWVPTLPANAPADAPDFAARVKAIAADPHFANVSVLAQPINSLQFPAPLDLIWTSQNYHDFHNIPGGDIGALNKRIFDALKPGGVFLVLDHAAAAGSGTRDTGTLHRIDPQTVKTQVLAAGFVLEAESSVLRNPADPHDIKVFAPQIRGRTDQFVFKFRKPAR